MKKTSPEPQVILPTLDIFPSDGKDINKFLGKMKLGQKIKIAFFGSDNFVVPVLQALEANFDLISVVTAPGSAIELEAKKLGIPTLTPGKLNDDFLTSHFSLLTSDLFVVASYGKILPQAILDLPKFGSLNIHPSLLPKYRGASPVPATILSGDKQTGVTIIKMDKKMDHGPIVSAKQIKLSGHEILPELITKLFQQGAELLIEIIPDFIEGKLRLKPQNHQQATYCQMMKKEDGYFDINNPPLAEKLDRMIRAYYPWPGVWTRFRASSAEAAAKAEQGSSGQAKIVKFLPASSHPELDSGSEKFLIQMEGKNIMSLKDFLNGYPDFPLKNLINSRNSPENHE